MAQFTSFNGFPESDRERTAKTKRQEAIARAEVEAQADAAARAARDDAHEAAARAALPKIIAALAGSDVAATIREIDPDLRAHNVAGWRLLAMALGEARLRQDPNALGVLASPDTWTFAAGGCGPQAEHAYRAALADDPVAAHIALLALTDRINKLCDCSRAVGADDAARWEALKFNSPHRLEQYLRDEAERARVRSGAEYEAHLRAVREARAGEGGGELLEAVKHLGEELFGKLRTAPERIAAKFTAGQ